MGWLSGVSTANMVLRDRQRMNIELFQIIRASDKRLKGLRQLTSGMVGIAKGQTIRISAVNTAEQPGDPSRLHARLGLVQNPSSELVKESSVSLGPGVSAFLDVGFDAIKSRDKARRQVRAVVTVLNDPESRCRATLEIFDTDTGKTSLCIELRETAEYQALRIT